MKKSFIFATMAAAALFAGCSSNDDLTSNPGGDVINPNTEQVAIKIGVAQAVSTGMRGTGTVGGVADIANGTDGYTAGADNIWAGQLINVYMFEKVTDANQKLTLAKDGQNASLYENTAMYTPGSADNKIPDMGAEAFTNFGEAMIKTGKIQYWPLNGNYDFFGYHGDDAVTAVNPVQDGDIVTAYKADFTIDGSQDLMSTKAAPTTDDTALPGYEASKIYSASMARKNIQPNLTFNHLLTRLTFNIKAGNDEAAGVKITGYKDGNTDKTIAEYNDAVATSQDVSGWTAVKAQTDPTTDAYTGVKVSKIEILSKKTGKMLVAWIADPTDKIEWDAETTNNAAYMTLKARSTAAGDIYGYIKKDRSGSIITAAAWNDITNADEKASYEPFYNPNKALVDLTPIAPGYNPGGATDEEKFIKTKVGESLIVSLPITATVDSTDPLNEVFSDVADNNVDNEAYYIARVTLTQKVRDNWNNDNLVEKSNSMVVKIPLPAGKTKFEINNSYNVNLTLYGFERIIVNTTLEAWKYGGEIDVIGE